MSPLTAVPYLTLALEATPRSVGVARARVTAFARREGAPDEQVAAIALAVSEAVANVVTHAYLDGQGAVELSADVEDGDLEVVVRDRGGGFRPGPAPGLGIGLALVATGCDDFDIREHTPTGVEVWMRFFLDR